MSCLRAIVLSTCLLTAAAAQPTWTAQKSGTTQDLWTVSYGTYDPNGTVPVPAYFVAAGTGGTILTSTDTVTWTQQNSPTTVWLVASVPGIIVGDLGTILTSSDGLIWTRRAGGSSGASRLNGIASGNGLVLAVGENGTVARSTDNGVDWIFGSSGTSGWLRGIVYNPRTQLFIICGEAGTLLTTADGMNFTALQSGTTSDLEALSLALVNNYVEAIMVGANGYLASSLDGVHWTPFIAPGGTHFRGAQVLSNAGIAVGSGGDTAFGYFNPNPYPTAQPGALPDLWEDVATGATPDLYGVAWGSPNAPAQNIVVAVGQGGAIFTSPEYQGFPAATNGILGPLATAYGQTVTLSITPVGQPPLSYQWTFNGQTIPGATQSSLTLPSIGPAQNGQYALTIGNLFGSTQVSAYTLAASYQAAIPGLVDESFSGQTVTPTLVSPQPPAAIAVQPDNQVIVGGTTSVTRLNADGTPDTAFNAAAALAIGGPYFLPDPGFNQLLLQSNGQIVVTGTFRTFPLDQVYSLSWRLNPDGTLDSSYTPVPTVYGGTILNSDNVTPLVQLASGLYLALQANSGGGPSVVRLNANATPDSGFQPFIPPGAPQGSGTMVKDSTGGIVLAVTTSTEPFQPGETYLCRLNPDGTYNASFTPQTLSGALVAGPFLLGGENIVVLTNELQGYNGTTTPSVYHLKGAGFTYAGVDIASTSALPWAIPAAVAGSDGSIYLYLAAPITSPSVGPGTPASLSDPAAIFQGTYRNGMIRIDPNGNFDPSYTLNIPLQTVSPGSGQLGITGLAPTPTNQWIAWGNFVLLNAETHETIARLNPQVGTNFASLTNLSARAFAGQGAQALDLGITTSGPANLPVLLRGVGPSLAAFGVTGLLADPQLTLYSASGTVQTSDQNWQDNGQGPAIAAAAQAVGAFALPAGSLDAAALAALTPGEHSVIVQGTNGGTGNALTEVYDASPNAITYGAARPINLSFRAPVGTGPSILTAGFVLGGGNTKHVLLRAIGPSLAAFGVSGAVPDPVLSLYSGTTLIASNQNWSANANQGALLAATFSDVGAFALTSGSADAALALDLSPGAYTVEATSASGASGIALVEVYEVP